MKKSFITIAINLGLALALNIQFLPVANAASSTAQPKATATLSAECTISAQNVNFGNLVLPLSAQTASSNMTVLCSNKASYTVALAYGGIYGAGTNGDYWVHEGCPQACATDYNWYYEYNSSGQVIAQQQFANDEGAGLYLPNEQIPGATYNASTGTFVVGTVYAYGEMTGVAKGDHVAYSISVPGNSSQIWNTGNSNYAGTGNGVSQSLPINATLVPSQSSSTYPSPDYYMDTVTATVNF
jgi:spore coat protein U-like protein